MPKRDLSNHPEAGQIIDFRYLARKDADSAAYAPPAIRPCLIWNAQAIETLQLVAVLPIASGATGARVSIGEAERRALGLESTADVLFEEANVFLWPGPHIALQHDRTLVRPQRASKQLLDEIGAGMTGRSCTVVFRP